MWCQTCNPSPGVSGALKRVFSLWAAAFFLAQVAIAQIALDSTSGDLWQTGQLANGVSCGMSTTAPGISETLTCSDATVTKLDPTGTQGLSTTRLGGTGNSGAVAIAVDSAGNVYVAGYTTAPDFPVTSGALQSKNAGPYTSQTDGSSVIPGGDVFIAKLNPDGSLAYSTFLGGTGNDVPTSIAVDGTGSVYVAGTTSSTDFPVTSAAVSKTPSGGFVAKIGPGGQSLSFATYFPATTSALAVDSAGATYLTGTATDTLLTTPGSVQPLFGGGGVDAFAAEISVDGSSLLYSTYLGGSGFDNAFALAVDSEGAAWIGGSTGSPSFPGTKGTGEAFLVKVAPDGSAIKTGSRFGPYPPTGGAGTAWVSVDSSDNVYASGFLFPPTGALLAPGFQPTGNAQLLIPCDAASGANFLMEKTPDGAQLYVSYMRQNGWLFLTGPGQLLLYSQAVSTLNLTSPPPLNFQCPVNGATYTTPAAPGEIVSLFGYGIGPQTGVAGQPDAGGSYPTSLAGVEVQFNGIPAPLLYVQAGQINTVVPRAALLATIQVSYQGQSAPPLYVAGQVANPGVFAILNQDGTVNSNMHPAKAGSIISAYTTGMNVAGVNFPDGQVAPLASLLPFNFSQNGDAVSFDGTAGTIVWEGVAPGLIFGVEQINIQLPPLPSITPPFRIFSMVLQSASVFSSPPFAVFVEP